MSLLFMEGWDMYGTTDNVVVGNWTEVIGTPVISLTGGSKNGKHVVMNSSGDVLRLDHTNITNSGNLYVGFQFKIDSLVTGTMVFFTDSDGVDASHSRLVIVSDGSIEFRDGGLVPTTLGTTASGVITAGVWHTIEFRIKPSTAGATVNSDGQAELRVNGTIRFNLTNLKIDPRDSTVPIAVGIGKTEFWGSSGVHRFDDIYLFDHTGALNNDFAGDFFIQTLRPASDTATASWTAVSAGDHYAEVDESEPDGDTTYVSSQTPTEADIYELTDLTGDVGAILGYGPIILARREVGATQNIAMRLIGASETVTGPAKNLAETYEIRSDVRDQSVDDASDTISPTISEVNALKAGVLIP